VTPPIVVQASVDVTVSGTTTAAFTFDAPEPK
jgi:hypothetical protein